MTSASIFVITIPSVVSKLIHPRTFVTFSWAVLNMRAPGEMGKVIFSSRHGYESIAVRAMHGTWDAVSMVISTTKTLSIVPVT